MPLPTPTKLEILAHTNKASHDAIKEEQRIFKTSRTKMQPLIKVGKLLEENPALRTSVLDSVNKTLQMMGVLNVPMDRPPDRR